MLHLLFKLEKYIQKLSSPFLYYFEAGLFAKPVVFHSSHVLCFLFGMLLKASCLWRLRI